MPNRATLSLNQAVSVRRIAGSHWRRWAAPARRSYRRSQGRCPKLGSPGIGSPLAGGTVALAPATFDVTQSAGNTKTLATTTVGESTQGA